MTMNHTINVSIAGVAFVLDSEGYELLKDYLVRIEVAYKDDPDGAEILSDIEARVSELILNRQSSDMIVSPELIREINRTARVAGRSDRSGARRGSRNT